jgi:uncharacterized membrane protein
MHASKARIHSIDILRGLVIAIMTIDHVREDFLHNVALTDPMHLQSTGAALFFTRWLAHFCAPVFVFLTGVSAYLHASRWHLPPKALSMFLLKRGLLLIAMEMTLVNVAWTLAVPPERIYLQVIWAIGCSMVFLSVLSLLPTRLLLSLGVVIVAGHNLMDAISFPPGGLAHAIWALLHERSWLHMGDLSIRTSYPVLPWIGVMALGYVCGRYFDYGFSAVTRRIYLLIAGVAAVVLFIVVRLSNLYGDTAIWQHYEGQPLMTMMSFLNVTKYPPSLLFLLMTLGPALLLLRSMEHWRGKLAHLLLTFGRVPFFYYVLHLYVLNIAYEVLCSIFGVSRFSVESTGWVWLISLVVLAALYPLVALFARLKARKASPILSYF